MPVVGMLELMRWVLTAVLVALTGITAIRTVVAAARLAAAVRATSRDIGEAEVANAAPREGLPVTAAWATGDDPGAAPCRLPVVDRIRSAEDLQRRLAGYGHMTVRFADAVWQMRALPQPDVRYAAETAFGPSRAALGRLRAAPNTCMLLGLFGTVLGLAFAVGTIGTSIASAAKAGQVEQLSDAIVGQLSQFGGAFACTLVGLACAVVCTWQVTAASQCLSHAVECAQRVVIARLLPLIVEPSVEASLDSIRTTLDRVGVSTQTTAQDMARTATVLGQHVYTLSRAAVAMSTLFQDSAATLKDSSSKLADNHAALRDLASSHREALERLTKDTETITAELRRTQLGLTHDVTTLLARMGDVGEAFTGSTRQFKEAADRFDAMSREIGMKAYDAMDARASDLVQASNYVAGVTRELVVDVQAMMDVIRELIHRVNPQTLPSEQWDRMTAALENVAAAGDLWSEEQTLLRATLDRQVGQFEQVARSVSEIPGPIARSLDDFAKHSTRVNRSLTVATETLGLTSGALGETATSVQALVGSLSADVGAAIGRLTACVEKSHASAVVAAGCLEAPSRPGGTGNGGDGLGNRGASAELRGDSAPDGGARGGSGQGCETATASGEVEAPSTSVGAE